MKKERIAKKLLKKLNLHISDDLKNVNTSNFNFNYLDGRLNYQEQKQDYLGSRLICINGEPEEQRKFKVINSYFISDHSLNKNELAEKYHVDRKTIDRDVKKAISDLSVMIFGIDGLNDMSK